MQEAYIYDCVRTPRGKGKPGGALYEVRPVDLLKTVLDALRERNQLDTEQVDDALIGCVTPVDDQGGNIAKTGLLYAEWSHQVPGMQLNRLCASGLESINLAATKVRSGWEDLVVGGGVESMSRVPMGSDGGPLMFDPAVSTATHYVPQGVSADLIAGTAGYSRQQLDEYALASHQRAAEAHASGYFDRSLVAVTDGNGLPILDHDEMIRPATTLDKLASLRPAFEKIGAYGYDAIALRRYPELYTVPHVHTAGNSSSLADGASLVLVGSEQIGQQFGWQPRARIVSFGTVSTEPTIMLQGPAPAARKALRKAGLQPGDIDLWEMNEAFASPVLKFQEAMAVPMDRLNVNGGAIAMGHPLGATGAILLGTLLDELERRDLKRGLAALCVGTGMGVATIIERV